jgi:DNA primase
MNNFTETVRDTADIVRVVSDYVALKGAGNTLKALCPFHSEKTPSFTVHRDKQFFHCFGCNAGGSVFDFIMRAERVTFPESVQIVAEKCGIPIPAQPGFSDPRSEERKGLLEIHERAAEYFRKMLGSDEAALAREVLAKRQIQPQFVERFGLGYAPRSGLLAQLKPKDPVSTGLFSRNDNGDVYDRFRRRLMFPIWNERGRTIAFGGRALGDDQPKYLNSAESSLYTKSYVLYGLHLAREAAQRAERLVVVEGYFDCLSLHQNGIENVVASCGTSLTQKQVDLMARYVPEVVMNYDPDAAGQNAMRRSIDLLLARNLRVRILKLPGNLDPDDFVRKEGNATYSKLLAAAPYFWQYLMVEAGRRFDLQDPALKAAAVRDVLEPVAKIQDRVERLEVAKAIADGFKVPETLVLERLNLTARGPEVAFPSRRSGTLPVSKKLPEAEKQLIQALIQDPKAGEALIPLQDSEFWQGVWSWPVVRRLLDSPANLDKAIEGIEDQDLIAEVRVAVIQMTSPLTIEYVLSSVYKLYDAHLARKEGDVREQLKTCGAGGAPLEVLTRLQEIVSERNRLHQRMRPNP